MISSLKVTNNENGTIHIEYTVNFVQFNHICYGSFDAEADEATKAFSGATSEDTWQGFKQLILEKLQNSAKEMLSPEPTQD